MQRRKITARVLSATLDAAMRATAAGITKTIAVALEELVRRTQREQLRALRGRVHFTLNLERTRH